MALEDIEYEDSTVHLYESLASREDFTDEFLEELVRQAVSDRVRQIYNNREELAVQAQMQGGNFEQAVEEEEDGDW